MDGQSRRKPGGAIGTTLASIGSDAWRFGNSFRLIASNSPREFGNQQKGLQMLHYAVVFLIIAIIAAVFGFTGIAVGAAEIAKVLFFIFLVLFVASLIVGMFRRGG